MLENTQIDDLKAIVDSKSYCKSIIIYSYSVSRTWPDRSIALSLTENLEICFMSICNIGCTVIETDSGALENLKSHIQETAHAQEPIASFHKRVTRPVVDRLEPITFKYKSRSCESL